MRKYIFCLNLTILSSVSFAQITNDSVAIKSETTVMDTNSMDTGIVKEAKIFIQETSEINDSLEGGQERVQVKNEMVLDTLKPYGVHFIKEFNMTGGIYHYLLMDVQHPEKLIHKPQWIKKSTERDYEDLIVKLEYKGDRMNLYSVILSEPIIGSLERFEKNYFVSDGKKILRVQVKSGHNNFFKDFADLYFEGDSEVLKGKRFKSPHSLVEFYNEFNYVQSE